MKTSVGYTVILNIVIIFIVIVFGVIAMCLSYYRSFKVSNVITHSIEKYEGYNYLAENEIVSKISALGYGSTSVKCPQTRSSCTLVKSGENSIQYSEGKLGYCVYECPLKDDQYYYKTTTNMLMNIPFINNILNIPIESNSRKLYGFSELTLNKKNNISCSETNSNYPGRKAYTCSGVTDWVSSGTWYELEDEGTKLSLIFEKNIEDEILNKCMATDGCNESGWGATQGYDFVKNLINLEMKAPTLDWGAAELSLPTKAQLSKFCTNSCNDGKYTKCGPEGAFLKANLNNQEGYWLQDSSGNLAWNIDYVNESTEQNNCELDEDQKNTTARIGFRPVMKIPKSAIK